MYLTVSVSAEPSLVIFINEPIKFTVSLSIVSRPLLGVAPMVVLIVSVLKYPIVLSAKSAKRTNLASSVSLFLLKAVFKLS